jgi:hypothetical protein
MATVSHMKHKINNRNSIIQFYHDRRRRCRILKHKNNNNKNNNNITISLYEKVYVNVQEIQIKQCTGLYQLAHFCIYYFMLT